MPDHQYATEQRRGHIRTRVILRRGEVISLCRCWQSGNFPLCDGAHKNIPEDWGPVNVSTECDEDFLQKGKPQDRM